ncbi:MAG: hypothetical protein MI747_23110, partial [Desulfobacterales bacterium]|nr:hypothetical protein [Desulfobacterales bacterium]
MDTLVAVYLIFGGGLALLSAPTCRSRLELAFFLSLGWWQFWGGLYHLDPRPFPQMNLLVPAIAGFCLWVPLMYGYGMARIKSNSGNPFPRPIHFIPALAAPMGLIPLWTSPADLRQAMALSSPWTSMPMLITAITLYLAMAMAVVYGCRLAWALRQNHAPHWLIFIPPVVGISWLADRLLGLGMAPLFYGLATTALIGRHLITSQRAPMPQPTEAAPKIPPPRPYAL